MVLFSSKNYVQEKNHWQLQTIGQVHVRGTCFSCWNIVRPFLRQTKFLIDCGVNFLINFDYFFNIWKSILTNSLPLYLLTEELAFGNPVIFQP